MRVLLVEDEKKEANFYKYALEAKYNIICDLAFTGDEGIELGKRYDYDAIILDIMLPDISGHEILLNFRNSGITSPVLMLSGLTSIDKKLKSFNIGADDFIVKPPHLGELAARIRCIVLRSQGYSSPSIKIGKHITLDLENRRITVNGKHLSVTKKEFSILELLALRKGSLLSKETFLNHLYGGIDEPDLKIIDVFICKLRKKLCNVLGSFPNIETVWGQGYILREENTNNTNNNNHNHNNNNNNNTNNNNNISIDKTAVSN